MKADWLISVPIYLVVQQDWEFALKNAVLKSAFSQHLSYIWNSSDGIRETDVPV